MNVIDLILREQEKPKVPRLRAGDTVRVHVKVVEGTRERLQAFEGLVIGVDGNGDARTRFTVRRISHGVGVERTFLLHSPRIDKVEMLRHGDVRRAKLYHLREKVGKHARVSERRDAIGGADLMRESELVVTGEDEPVEEQVTEVEVEAVTEQPEAVVEETTETTEEAVPVAAGEENGAE